MSRSTAHRLFPLALLLLIWAIAAVGIRHATIKTSFRLSQKRLEVKRLQEDLTKLKSRLEQLQSPARLERLAKENFHLGPAQRHQIITLQDTQESP